MRKTKAEKRIDELEDRIRRLEARPLPVVPIYVQPYSPYPWWGVVPPIQQPYYQPYYQPYTITGGGAGAANGTLTVSGSSAANLSNLSTAFQASGDTTLKVN